MILSPNVNVYLKTTETCNLNCSHCFTSGSQGKKIFFSPEKVAAFFQELKETCPWIKNIRFMFHGGEPLLAPIGDLYDSWNRLKAIYPDAAFGLQTNLIFPLTDEKRKFLKEVLLNDGFGTSWDYDIRFGSSARGHENFEDLRAKQRELWENNVRTLIQDGHRLTMIVSITKKLIQEKEPIDIINYARDLGFHHILFERITIDGNAKKNSEVIPENRLQDEWLWKMFRQTIEFKTYEYIDNMLMSEIADAFINHNHTGNRCRNCEQSLLTINADGTIAGCPNTAPQDYWGHIDRPVLENLRSKKRTQQISCESLQRNPVCFTCPAFQYCNSDCSKLPWDDNETYCAAPKKVWHEMIQNQDIKEYKKLILRKNVEGAHGI